MTAVGKLTSSLLIPSARVRDGRFLDAVTAAVALVTEAGGVVDRGKREGCSRLLHSIEDLRAFDEQLIVNSFEVFADLIGERNEEGRAQALKAVSEVAGDPEGAKTVVRIASAMACTSGYVGPAQRVRLEEIATAAGLSASGLEAEANRAGPDGRRPRSVITVGSPKGGTGKTTTAVHMAVGLIKLGHRVGSIDLDGAQGTMSRYFTNRALLAREAGRDLGSPQHRRIEPSRQVDRVLAEAEEETNLRNALSDLKDCAYVVIDTPGHDCQLARLACCHADTLITPLNDSLIDIEILARVDRRKREVLGPSEYCKFVWEENDRRVASGRRPIDWIVMRNRLGHVEARNNREVYRLLRQLSQRIGFRLVHGLSERVAFREYFLEGLTLLDLPEARPESALHRSRLRARQEIDDLLAEIQAPQWNAAAQSNERAIAAGP